MAKSGLTNKSIEFAIAGRWYMLLDEYGEPENTVEYFNALAKAEQDFIVKFNHHPLAKHMALALDDYLTEKARNQKHD